MFQGKVLPPPSKPAPVIVFLVPVGTFWAPFQAYTISNSGFPSATRAVCFLLASLLAYSSTLWMEVVSSSESQVTFYRIIRRHIPENNSLQTYP